MEEFRKLGLSKAILENLEKMGFTEPTEIQKKSIPSVLQGKDVIAGSVTGSGKTLVFGAGIIHNWKSLRKIQAIVLVPTRELAEQGSEALRSFANHSLQIEAVYGGVSIGNQIKRLPYADVVVGTPGRILDHIDRGTINLRNVKILVLDEADRMLDMGFVRDVEDIINECPRDRQTLMFSATISDDIQYLYRKYMRSPVKILVNSYLDPSKLSQFYYSISDGEKFSLLVHLLKNEDSKLVMVFCNTQRNTDFVANNLKAEGINALAIHGGFSQDKRTKVLEEFHNQNISVLVCTDVAARGLDIKEVSHVYNYDLPPDSKAYIHRVGRTARAGEEGKAINILCRKDYDNFRTILRNPKLTIESLPVPRIKRVYIKWIQRQRDFGSRGGFGRNNRNSSAYGSNSRNRGAGYSRSNRNRSGYSGSGKSRSSNRW